MSTNLITEQTTLCACCNRQVAIANTLYVEEETYCEACYDCNVVSCDTCGHDMHYDNAVRDDYTTLCPQCFEDDYVRCDDCGCIIRNDRACYSGYGDTPFCNDCYHGDDSEDDIYLHDYNYKPDPIFCGKDCSRYFGVELEIDYGGQSRNNAELITDIGNSINDHIYIKTDGSLSEGLEIVTHPMTLMYHKSNMPWKKVIQKALNLHYRSHRTETCGLHIHVNRSCFADTHELQEKYISKILYFVEHHWKEMLRFSRRTQSQIDRWARRYGIKSTDKPNDVLYAAKSGGIGRYAAVNITNYSTIEFRLFRGTLKYNTLIATLQMVDAICDVAILFTDENLEVLSWSEFVSSLPTDKYPELITYLKERRLYVNEPIETAEGEQ